MSPHLRRASELIPPAALVAASLVLAVQGGFDAIDPGLLRFLLLLALFEFVSSMLESIVALRRTLDLRVGRALVFVLATAALVATTLSFVRAVFTPVLSAMAATIAVVSVRFASQVADPAADELARLRSAALANDRFDSVRAILGALPILSLPLFVLGAMLRFTSWRPPEELRVTTWIASASIVLALSWGLMLAAAAWRAYSPGFAQRPRRLFLELPWPWLLDWYELPHRRQQYRRERMLELREATRFERRRARGCGGAVRKTDSR